MFRTSKNHAFTLAEVLIVIGVIGVIAAITIPTLIPLINDTVDKNRKEVIEDRLIQGFNQLNTLDDGFNGSQYVSDGTVGFVRALSKYYKMSQICDAHELANCFPYDKINLTLNNKDLSLDVSDFDTPEAFGLKSAGYLPPAGFISANGTSFIFLLKKDCLKDTGEAIKTFPADCVQYIYDNNGSNSPNKLGNDIVYSTGIKFPMPPDGVLDNPIDGYSKYLVLGDNYTSINTCNGSDDIKWDERGSNNPYCSDNKWAGGKKACDDLGYEMPDMETLGKVYCRYRGESVYKIIESGKSVTQNCDISAKDTKLAKVISTKSSMSTGNGFWAATPAGNYTAVEYRFHYPNGGEVYNNQKVSTGHHVLCLGHK